jgi:prolipoprotein diacylglyceryltransferase
VTAGRPYTAADVPHATTPAVIQLAFDPTVRLDALAIRLETIALAVVILTALVVAARIARATSADPFADVQLPSGWQPPRRAGHLRRDDLLFIVLGILPGAVIGGRLGYALVHLDYFGANPRAIIDPSIGSMQLSLAVAGGLATGWLIASLLETPAGRWLHVATLPLLFALGVGKLVLVLGGDGQGQPASLPWATAYTGAGPWGSLAPAVPSHPAQVYEALATGLVAVVMIALLGGGRFRSRDGRAFFVALGLWAVARFVVAIAWRDATVLGPLRADQLLSLAVLGIAILGFATAPWALRRFAQADERRRLEAEVRWPDPERPAA